ncbi:hypothetical protein [Larkinella arboricola]|uniref:Uncharacterized protein n=1 Tax=Larkinella arboricola TaxID=643671 RepID=A0A327WVP6_LARAB|nr:hypothetical protein [Larkinella arboricola]RAJ97417.1 hypothetical protein LX87_02317 [Larkinella arboricola]
MSARIKPTVNNIISLWFSVDTPLRQYKIRLNPEIWGACQTINQNFNPPSKRKPVEQFKKNDKVAFAKAVQEQLERGKAY